MRKLFLSVLALSLAAGAGQADAAGGPGSLPRLESRRGEPLTAADTSALVAWALAQPEVKAATGGHRTRVLRAGADSPKLESGGEGWRALIYVRDYDAGLVHRIEVDLDTAALEVEELLDWVQPNDEEFRAAVAVVARDRELGPLVADPRIHVTGGFYERSPYAGDPCSKDVCLYVELMHAGHGQGFAKRLIVNLSRETIANRDYQWSGDPDRPTPLTDLGGN
jgi:hypothetical protein